MRVFSSASARRRLTSAAAADREVKVISDARFQWRQTRLRDLLAIREFCPVTERRRGYFMLYAGFAKRDVGYAEPLRDVDHRFFPNEIVEF